MVSLSYHEFVVGLVYKQATEGRSLGVFNMTA